MVMLSLLAVPVLAAIAVEDIRDHRIRNRHLLVLSLAVSVVVGVGVVGDGVGVLGKAALGACLAAGPLVVAGLAQPNRMGGGDVKLAAVVGVLLGAIQPWFSVAAIGAALFLTLLAAQIRRLSNPPLAPGLATATFGALIYAMT